MQIKTDVLVVGGGPAGIVGAVTAKKYYPDKKITVMKKTKEGVIPCGIPYMFSSLKDPDENRLGTAPLEKNNIETVVDKAVKINRGSKAIETASGDLFKYEKLIMAHGSSPIIPPIPGIDKKGVYPIHKDMQYLKDAIKQIKKAKNVLIIGGGFIGIEFADEISKIKGINVHLVEMLPHLLANSFDREFSDIAKSKLDAENVRITTGTSVKELLGDERVQKARLSDKREIPVDAVILGVGATPNTALSADAELDLGKGKGIWVDEYMRTIDPDIFAIGDCAGKRDFYTRKDAPVMLASITRGPSPFIPLMSTGRCWAQRDSRNPAPKGRVSRS